MNLGKGVSNVSIRIDIREKDLIQQINNLITNIPIFANLSVIVETLPLGDIIITDKKSCEDKLIIERKSLTDLLASIKDGRYEEQSYRLNGITHHNHNIIYLIEGDVINKYNIKNRFKLSNHNENGIEKLTLYSAMFSLNYYKGFSVFRTVSLEETATVICNMAYKLDKETQNIKHAYYKNHVVNNMNELKNEKIEPTIETINKEDINEEINEKEMNEINKTNKNNEYVNVVKRVKKENITVDNIDEIMLCQIPGISSITAITIIEKYKSLANLIDELNKDNNCLENISTTNTKGQTRKISKAIIANIVKFLLKK